MVQSEDSPALPKHYANLEFLDQAGKMPRHFAAEAGNLFLVQHVVEKCAGVDILICPQTQHHLLASWPRMSMRHSTPSLQCRDENDRKPYTSLHERGHLSWASACNLGAALSRARSQLNGASPTPAESCCVRAAPDCERQEVLYKVARISENREGLGLSGGSLMCEM